MNSVVNTVETEVKKIEGEVVAEIKAVATAVEKVVERTVQALTAEEKLAIRDIEVSYLKAQSEITRLSQITQKAQKDFTDTIESLVKRYAVSPAEWVFDNVELLFKRK